MLTTGHGSYLIGCVLLNGQTRSDTVWPVVSPAAGEKERPGRVRPGLASQKERSHSYYPQIDVVMSSVTSVLYVCMTVCNTIIVEHIDVKCSYLGYGYILMGYVSCSYMKVIGSRSRSQRQKSAKFFLPIGI